MARSPFIMPKNARDKVIFMVMPVAIPLVIIWEFGVILPNYHESVNTTVVLHVLTSAYIFANIFGNMILAVWTDPSGRKSFLPSVRNQEWKYCYECKLQVPPRSYHCYICNECILKRSHHCLFTGNCIGYHNHRYYLVGIAYIFVGTIYAFLYQSEYCFSQMGGRSWVTLLSMTAPHFGLVMGYITLYGFFLSVMQILGLVVILVCAYLLTSQLTAVVNGQTQHERKNDVRTFDLGWRRNVVEVFGARWPLVCFSPTIDSPLPGDGLRFVEAQDYEDVKEM